MKLRNRIMSWILSPGAYAVWHALGNPEEWELGGYRLIHKSSGVTLWVDVDDGPSIFMQAFFFNGAGNTPKFMGLFERHLVWQRGYRTCLILKGQKTRRQHNLDVFAKLTVNQ